MIMQPDVSAPDVREEALERIERRIRELEQLRDSKVCGSWLYRMDTTVLDRLKAERDGLTAGSGELCA